MKVVFTRQAHMDLKEIHDYISNNLQNPISAKAVAERIIKSCSLLSQQPNMGVSLQAKTGRETDYRCLFCGNYIAFYKRNDNSVVVSRILDGRTDYLRVIFS